MVHVLYFLRVWHASQEFRAPLVDVLRRTEYDGLLDLDELLWAVLQAR